ncbi:MAG TPA: adenylate/guanylate cyclase domain-containing protein, partial [Chthoniobacterales bacterium]|nr:adenylate/guanylate cyclase domain-containing protein [Chthoniobacterales bacterium]
EIKPFAYLSARNLLRDAIARAGRPTAPNPHLVFLAIDSASVSLEEGTDLNEMYDIDESSDSIEARALRAMSQRWPWPREVHALVLERLIEAGAKVVMFDLMFPTATDGDEPFRAALDKYRDRVVIGSNFVPAVANGFITTPASHTRPSDTLVPQTVPMDDRVAYTNFWPDEDDIVRRAHFRVTSEQVQDLDVRPNTERFLSLAARGRTKAGHASVIPPGITPQKFRWTAPPRQGFPPRSLFEIFVPDYWKYNYRSGEFFRDKIVMIGAEGNWHHDEHGTPWGSMPGPELHLNAMNAALHGEFIREMERGEILLITLCAAAFAVAISLVVRSPWLRLLVLLAADALIIWIGLWVFNNAATYVPFLPALLQMNVTVLLALVCDFTSERVEKKRVRRALERYVSTNVVSELLDHPAAFQQALGGVIKPVAVLFIDIRGFSGIAARSNPQTLVSQLNEYLSAMVECVFRHGGTLDKFIGDAVMAVWGNVRSGGSRDDATNAVRAALAMRQELARLNAEWRKRRLPDLRVGIGVHHGDVVVGNIGSAQRMEFTVIGEAVNVTWKLQELTKQLGSDLLVSENVAPLVVEEFELVSLGLVSVPGCAEQMEVFSVAAAVDLAATEPAEVPAPRYRPAAAAT